MEKYEQLAVVGEGSYGLVMKCRHRDSDQIVAVKKFLETEEDATLRRMALREIRMLKRLRHENLVTMIEVFRHRKRFYLVFEYVEGTVLDELEKHPEGLGDERTRERIYQVARALQYCHSNHIIHRDVKPENVLVSSRGVVKLCDFGFARLVGGTGESYTEYVATRWYRAPELLVGEQHYGAPVDIWAVGCLFSEMMTGEPLFPGESDIDQLFLIVKLIGKPCTRHQQLMHKNAQLRGIKRSPAMEQNTIYKLFPTWSLLSVDFLCSCTKMDPQYRPSADELLKHNYFSHDKFPEKFLPALREKVRIEFNDNPLLRKFRADIFMSQDYRREEKPKRIVEPPPRWKINFVQGSVKRKFSSDTINSEDGKSLISLNKSGHKINSNLQKLTQLSKNGSLQSMKKDESSKEIGPVKREDRSPNISEKYSSATFIIPKLSQEKSDKFSYTSRESNPRLEKALDLLQKLNKKNNYCRPKSTNKDLHQYANLPTSPPEFQSLQSQSFREITKSPTLHPSITSITFNRESRKSPQLVQSVNNLSLKSVFSQVPVIHPPKGQYLKNLNKYVVETTTIQTEQNRHNSPPDWMSSVGVAQKKRDPWKNKDDFTLPTVPGATGSPNKSKQKKQTPEHLPESVVQTPIIKQNCLSYKIIDLKLKSPFPNKKVNRY